MAELSEENSCLVQEWNADVFCSSWISNCGSHRPACSELALVHDCLPERIRPDQPELMALRRRWWQQAAAHLAVSSATAEDLAHLLQKSGSSTPLVPPCSCGKLFIKQLIPWRAVLWRVFKEAGLPDEFVPLAGDQCDWQLQKSRARGSGSRGSRPSFAAAFALWHCCRAAGP